MSAWRPMKPKTRERAHALAVRAIVPALSGVDAASYVRAILDELEAGEVRDAFHVARHHLPEEIPDVTVGVVVACYVQNAVDGSVEQRDDAELLGDAGVPSDIVSAVLAELRQSTKGRAA